MTSPDLVTHTVRAARRTDGRRISAHTSAHVEQVATVNSRCAHTGSHTTGLDTVATVSDAVSTRQPLRLIAASSAASSDPTP